MTDLHVDVYGEGPSAVFIHGSFGWGLATFPQQRSLADVYRLFLVDRRGSGRSPDADTVGWPTDAEDVTGLLEAVGPAHLVGQSYGAVVALLVAGRHPELVNSIVAIEPVVFEAARGDPRADAMIAALKPVFERAQEMNARAFVAAWMAAQGHTREAIAERIEGYSEQDWRAAEASRRERWDAPVAFEALAAASFPRVIVRGAWQAQRRAGRVMPAEAMQPPQKQWHESPGRSWSSSNPRRTTLRSRNQSGSTTCCGGSGRHTQGSEMVRLRRPYFVKALTLSNPWSGSSMMLWLAKEAAQRRVEALSNVN